MRHDSATNVKAQSPKVVKNGIEIPNGLQAPVVRNRHHIMNTLQSTDLIKDNIAKFK